MIDRRTRKRLATRRAISDAATRLIFDKGFDNVTIDEIAHAADVGRMTVFNHFSRKEDLFLDREQELHDLAFDAVRTRGGGTSPIEALRLLAHRLIEQPDPPFPLFEGAERFVETVLESEALKARARQMRDDFVRALAMILAEVAGRPEQDAEAAFAAALLAAAWASAFLQAHALLLRSHDVAAAERLFLDLVDRGTIGAKAALSGTAYC
jgi:AcrR family transcriptional regulator